MRFYFTHPSPSGPIIPQGLLKVCMADATFDYGIEFLGNSLCSAGFSLHWIRNIL